MPGIQLHASVADSILSNRFIAPAPRWTAVAATLASRSTVGSGVGHAAVLGRGRGCRRARCRGWTGASLYAFDRGLWLVMAQPILATAVALFAGTAYRYFVEDAEKRKVSRLFGRYVSRDVYKQLMANPGLAELGGGRREMSVLFSDLRGFTTITEKGNPEDLVLQLNEYFTRMVEIVFRNGGTVDKFVGDMVMALFGAPVDDVDHADDAVTTAVEMVRELGELNRRWAAEGRVQLDIGIGVNSGDMIAGNIGSAAIMSYTVIGDNVNLGARLESLNKEYRTRIIISEATRARLAKSYEMRPLGGVVVKGKTRPVEIFEVIAPSPLVATAGDVQRRSPGNMRENPYEKVCTRRWASSSWPALSIGVRPAAAQLGGITGALNKAAKVKKIADLKVTDAEEQPDRPAGQRQDRRDVWRLPGCQRHQVRHARRRGAGAGRARAPASTGSSWCSTLKASTRSPRPAASSTSRRACSG